MITIQLPEISEMKRYPARSNIPKKINKSSVTFRNYDIPKKEGIYFIFDKNDDIIYIGESIDIQSRVSGHCNGNSSPIKNKDEIVNVSFICIEDYKKDTESIERIYIDFYKPKYNDTQY